jgi:hypothetical protein
VRNKAPKLAMLTKRLLEAMKNLGQALQLNTRKISEAVEAGKNDGPLEVHAEVRTPQGIETRRSATDANEDRLHQHRTLLVAWLTFFAIVVYSILVYYQWREMQKATVATQEAAAAATSAANTADQNLKNSKESFRIEQRPYLVADVPQFVVGPLAPGKPSANVTLKNIGRTPAVRIQSQLALLQFRPLKKSPEGTEKVVTFMQENFQKLEHKIDVGNAEKYSELAREDLAPNATTFSTAELGESISTPEIADIQNGGVMSLFCIGVVRYTDAYDGNYETQFCYFYFGSDPKTWHVCDNHNIIK